jgi:hypothetical protein
LSHKSTTILFLSAAALLFSACSVQEGVVAPSTPVPTVSSDPAFQSPAQPGETPEASPLERALVDPALQDLAKRLGVAPEAIVVVEVIEIDWPDASLGCPAPDMAYAQVITPGMQVMLESGGQTYAYHGSGPDDLFLCGSDGPAPPVK